MDYKKIAASAIGGKKAELYELSQWVYAHPETAMQEKETSAKLAQYLKDNGFEVETDVAGVPYSFKASKKKGHGRTVALMVEYDALPEIGHACGHHLIAASTIAAGIGLGAAIDAGMAGEVILVGAPAEETGEGKPPLVDAGVFDGVDAAMSWHPSCMTLSKPQWISIGGIDFHFIGKAAHAGSYPYDGVNALDAVVLFYNSFSVLRQQLSDGSRIHGIIMDGGSAANIIPDSATIRLEFRSPDANYFDEIINKVIKCAEGAAVATGCELEYHNYEPTCCGVIQNDVLAKEYIAQLEEHGLTEDDRNFLGSTDAGNVSAVCPTLHPLFKVTDLDCGLHTAEFLEETGTADAFERCFTGSLILADVLYKVLDDASFAAKVRSDFENR